MRAAELLRLGTNSPAGFTTGGELKMLHLISRVTTKNLQYTIANIICVVLRLLGSRLTTIVSKS